jgi:hypothetical protein
MFPNCDSVNSVTSRNCDAAQVDEDIRRFERDLFTRDYELQGLRDLSHLDVGILRKLDDVSRRAQNLNDELG